MEKLIKLAILIPLMAALAVFLSFPEAAEPVVKSSAAEAKVEEPAPEVKIPAPAETAPVAVESADKKPVVKTQIVVKPQIQESPKTQEVPKPVEPSDCSAGSFATQFLCLINDYRTSKGLNTLTYDSALNKVAFDYSTVMKENNHFSHTGPDGSKFYERCAAQNTTCYAENLGFGFSSAQHVFDLWKASPGHNKNMVGPYHQIGLGINGSYATTLFR